MTEADAVELIVSTIYINANDPVGLHRLLTEHVGLPDMQSPRFDQTRYDVKATVGLGPVDLEMSRFRNAQDLPGGPEAAYFGGIGLATRSDPRHLLKRRGVRFQLFTWSAEDVTWEYAAVTGAGRHTVLGVARRDPYPTTHEVTPGDGMGVEVRVATSSAARRWVWNGVLGRDRETTEPFADTNGTTVLFETGHVSGVTRVSGAAADEVAQRVVERGLLNAEGLVTPGLRLEFGGRPE